MNILFVTGIYPPDVGGPAQYVRRFGRELARRGHGARVITLSDAAGRENDQGVDVIRLPRQMRAARARRAFHTIAALLEHGKWADIIYDNGCPWDTGFPCLFARPFAKKPLVVKITGDVPWEFLRIRRSIDDSLEEFQTKQYPTLISALRWTQRHVVRRADHVITPSQYLKKLSVCWGAPEGKVSVILNALDASEPAPDTTIDFPIPDGGFKLCTAARMAPHKGVAAIIDAVAAIPGVSLTALGDGPELDNLRAQAARLGVADRVSLPGRVPQGVVPAVMACCDLFVLNTEYEGLPHTVLEAFGAGLPVLTTNVCGNPEVVTHEQNGLLIPPRDPAALKAAIQRAMAEPERLKSFAERSRGKLREFSWETLYDQTVALFEKVIAEKGR